MENVMIDHVAVQGSDKHNFISPTRLKDVAQSLEWKLICDFKKRSCMQSVLASTLSNPLHMCISASAAGRALTLGPKTWNFNIFHFVIPSSMRTFFSQLKSTITKLTLLPGCFVFHVALNLVKHHWRDSPNRPMNCDDMLLAQLSVTGFVHI